MSSPVITASSRMDTPLYKVGLGVLGFVLIVFLVLAQVITAIAHTADIQITKVVCLVTGDFEATAELDLKNIPNNVTTDVESYLGTSTFVSNWNHASFAGDWTLVADDVPSTQDKVIFQVTVPGNTVGSPWLYANSSYSDNNPDTHSDVQIPNLKGDCKPQLKPPSGTVTFDDTKCDALTPVGNIVHVSALNDNTTAEGFLDNNGTYVSIGNLLVGNYGDVKIDDYGYPAKVRIVLTGEDGTQLPPFDHTFTMAPKNAADCLTVIPTPPKPPDAQSSCLADGVRPAPGDPNGAYLLPDTGPGDYVLRFTAPVGQTYATGTTVDYTVTVPAKKAAHSVDCPDTVTPVNPDVKESVCIATNTPSLPKYIVASTPGVAYFIKVNGVDVPIAAGEHTAQNNETVVITAKAADATHVLSDPNWSWSKTFTTVICLDHLALTGNTIGGGITLFLLIALLYGCTQAYQRVKRVEEGF